MTDLKAKYEAKIAELEGQLSDQKTLQAEIDLLKKTGDPVIEVPLSLLQGWMEYGQVIPTGDQPAAVIVRLLGETQRHIKAAGLTMRGDKVEAVSTDTSVLQALTAQKLKEQLDAAPENGATKAA